MLLEPPEERSDRIEESLVHPVKGVPQLLVGTESLSCCTESQQGTKVCEAVLLSVVQECHTR